MVSSEVGAQEKQFLLNQSPNVQNVTNVSASVRRFNRIEVHSVLEDRKKDQTSSFKYIGALITKSKLAFFQQPVAYDSRGMRSTLWTATAVRPSSTRSCSTGPSSSSRWGPATSCRCSPSPPSRTPSTRSLPSSRGSWAGGGERGAADAAATHCFPPCVSPPPLC